MYIGYINDRQDLGFMCLKDIEDGKQITLILKTGVIYLFMKLVKYIFFLSILVGIFVIVYRNCNGKGFGRFNSF